MTASLVFVFSCPYLVAAVATRRAHFLYATMLLGAVAYFLVCYALGAPAAFFPLLSLPLVAALWLVGQRLRRRLPADLASFPRTVFRAMNITVGVFAIMALVQAPRLLAAPGLGRWVATGTCLGYAALYLAHSIVGAPAFYIYILSAFLIVGGVLSGAAMGPAVLCWLPTLAAAVAILFVGLRLHRARTYAWSRHFYASAAAGIAVSLVFSALRWTYLLLDLALASLALWAAYQGLASAIGDVRRATLAERALAKWFFLGALALSGPLVPVALVLPGNAYVALAALLYGGIFGWTGWQRRQDASATRNLYLLAASFFGSAGACGIGRALPGAWASAWSVASPLLVLAGLGALCVRLRKAGAEAAWRSLANGVVFPAFFAWHVPLLAGEPGIALLGAAAASAGAVALTRWLSDEGFLRGLGPSGAGLFVALAVLSVGVGSAAWAACIGAAVAAAGGFVWADARGREVALMGSYNMNSGRLFTNLVKAPWFFLKGKVALSPHKIRRIGRLQRVFQRVEEIERT